MKRLFLILAGIALAPARALADPPALTQREQIVEAQRVVKACSSVLAKCRAAIDSEVLAMQRRLGELETWQSLLAERDADAPELAELAERIGELSQQREARLSQAAEAPHRPADWSELRPLLAELLKPPANPSP